MKKPCDFCVYKDDEFCSCEKLNRYELYVDTYNKALEDMRKAILTDKELQFAPYSQDMWFKNRIMDIAERLTR